MNLHRSQFRTCRTALSAMLAALALASPAARALSFGDVGSQSSLGEPLRLTIPIAAQEDELANACFVLVPPVGSRRGSAAIVTGKVSLERTASGARLVVTSSVPATEPLLRFAIESSCGSAIHRDFVAILDPLEALPDAGSSQHAAGSDAPFVKPAAGNALRANGRTAGGFQRADAKAGIAGAAPSKTSRSRPIPTQPPLPVAAAIEPPQGAWHRLTTAIAANFTGAISSASARTNAAALAAQSTAAAGVQEAAAAPARGALPSTPVARGTWQDSLASLWPYALAAGGFALFAVALAMQRKQQRAQVDPSWLTASTKPQTIMHGSDVPMTFAHFGALTERPRATSSPASKPPGKSMSQSSKDRKEPTLAIEPLDTLLGELETDAIAERAVRDAWATAERNIKSEAILKAIDDAERHHDFGLDEATHSTDLDLRRDLQSLQAKKSA